MRISDWSSDVCSSDLPDAEIGLFLDADIEFIDDAVLAELLERLTTDPELLAVSGHPVKDILKKPRKTPIDRFSLIISRQSPTPHRSEEPTSELQPLMRTSSALFCLKKNRPTIVDK